MNAIDEAYFNEASAAASVALGGACDCPVQVSNGRRSSKTGAVADPLGIAAAVPTQAS